MQPQPANVVDVDLASLPRFGGFPLDVDLLRAELSAFSDDRFTITSFNVTYRLDDDGVSSVESVGGLYEVGVRTAQQAGFVSDVLGPRLDWFVVLVVGDLGMTIPDTAPGSMHHLSYYALVARRIRGCNFLHSYF